MALKQITSAIANESGTLLATHPGGVASAAAAVGGIGTTVEQARFSVSHQTAAAADTTLEALKARGTFRAAGIESVLDRMSASHQASAFGLLNNSEAFRAAAVGGIGTTVEQARFSVSHQTAAAADTTLEALKARGTIRAAGMDSVLASELARMSAPSLMSRSASRNPISKSLVFRDEITHAPRNTQRKSAPGLLDPHPEQPDLRLKEADWLEPMARITLEEGIPMIGVLTPEIEDLLIGAPAHQRSRVLAEQQGNILNYCLRILGNTDNEWAKECRVAIEVLASGSYSAAQSHAAGITESILRHRYGKDAARKAKDRARQDMTSLSLPAAREILVLRPVVLAFAHWYPDSGDPIPTHFARHPTVHAVGHPGVFTKEKALISVMLAVSLTRHANNRLHGR